MSNQSVWKLIAIISSIAQASCTVTPQHELPTSWTELELDKFWVDSYRGDNFGEEFKGAATGTVVELWAKIADEIRSGEPECRNFSIRNHIFVYHYNGNKIELEIHSRFVPDPTSVKGAYIGDDGRVVVKAPALTGATRAEGCYFKFEYNIETGQLLHTPYVPAHENDLKN